MIEFPKGLLITNLIRTPHAISEETKKMILYNEFMVSRFPTKSE